MKKISFIILPEKGHINPYIGPAQALQELGHTVTIASIGDISNQIEKAGLKFDRALLSLKKTTQPMRGKDLVELISHKAAMKTWIKALLLDISQEDVNKYITWIKTEKPDILVIDPLAYAAVIAAEVTTTAWVSMSNSLNPILESSVKSDLLETLSEIEDQRSKLFKTFNVNVNFNGCDALSKYLTIAFCTPEFVGHRNNTVHMVGPSLPIKGRGDEEIFKLETNRPIIYASFGSQIFYWPEIFENLIVATRNEGWQLKLSVGDLVHTLPQEDHVTLYSYAPQLDILPKASVFITHGGANSVMEALRAKTKLWVSPMCNDQFHQAYYVNKSGLGWVEDIRSLSPVEIKQRLKKILTDPAIHENLQRVTPSYQVDGSRKSAQLISDLL